MTNNENRFEISETMYTKYAIDRFCMGLGEEIDADYFYKNLYLHARMDFCPECGETGNCGRIILQYSLRILYRKLFSEDGNLSDF